MLKNSRQTNIIIYQAKKWFKEKVVDVSFKDPYSYRVVGVKAVPVTTSEWADRYIEETVQQINETGYGHLMETGLKNFDIVEEHLNRKIDGLKLKIKEEEIEMSKYKDSYEPIEQKLYKLHSEVRNEYVKEKNNLLTFIRAEIHLNKLVQLKARMNENELSHIDSYDIHLDCYSKNSYGNEVLTRYVFPFTKDGPFRNEETTLRYLKIVN